MVSTYLTLPSCGEMLTFFIHVCITRASIWNGHRHAFPGEYFQNDEGHEAALNQWDSAAYLMTNRNLKSDVD